MLHYGGNNSETDASYIIRKHRTIKLLRQIVGAVSFSFNFADAEYTHDGARNVL